MFEHNMQLNLWQSPMGCPVSVSSSYHPMTSPDCSGAELPLAEVGASSRARWLGGLCTLCLDVWEVTVGSVQHSACFLAFSPAVLTGRWRGRLQVAACPTMPLDGGDVVCLMACSAQSICG
jgi:hypothetical protein